MTKQNKTRLNELYKAQQRLKYPEFPEQYIPDYKNSDNSTNGLTKCVIDFINMSGGFAERINTTGRYIGGKIIEGANGRVQTQGKWIKGTGTKGSADISAVIQGRTVKIEIKYGRDRQSDDQKEYQSNIERSGGLYWIVRTFDDFIDKYDALTNHPDK
jgi:hypothetical protein